MMYYYPSSVKIGLGLVKLGPPCATEPILRRSCEILGLPAHILPPRHALKEGPERSTKLPSGWQRLHTLTHLA
jgi:hypothetical protein